MKRIFLLLIGVVLLGGFLRFYHLGDVPAGFHRDEAFLGYNAYSILKTGKDMNDISLPLHLKSFLYSPAGYSYASIPFIAAFGLNALSIRFASALFGTMTIFSTYLLVLELFRKLEIENWKLRAIALLSALLLAVSPWHINLSRVATENTIVVFFITLGTLLYLIWHRNNKLVFLLASFFSFGLTIFIYQASRAFLPLFIPVLLIAYRKRIRLSVAIFFLTILIPIVLIFRSPTLSLRLNTISIFSNAETQLTLDESLREDGVAKQPTILARAFHNKAVAYTQLLVQNYFSHFSYPFLFTDKGLPDRYRIPNQGILYLVELPLLLIGLYALFKERKPYSWLLLSWIFLAPVGSSIAFDDVPNLQRTLLAFPALSIAAALGLVEGINLTAKAKRSLIGLPARHRYAQALAGGLVYWVIGLFATFNVASYLHSYYVHQPIHRPWSRHEGYKELVAKTNELLPNYQKAIITDRQSAPTIFFLFFGKYDPEKFQEDTRTSTFPDYDRIAFANYEFSQEECPLQIDKTGQGITGKPEILYVNFGTCKTPEGATELAVIRRGDSSIVFRILSL